MFGHIVYVFSGVEDILSRLCEFSWTVFEDLNQVKISASFNWTRILEVQYLCIFIPLILNCTLFNIPQAYRAAVGWVAYSQAGWSHRPGNCAGTLRFDGSGAQVAALLPSGAKKQGVVVVSMLLWPLAEVLVGVIECGTIWSFSGVDWEWRPKGSSPGAKTLKSFVKTFTVHRWTWSWML